MSVEVAKTVTLHVAIKDDGSVINLVFNGESVSFEFSVKGTAGYIIIANNFAKAMADSIVEGLAQ
jgi:hypothetical protein